MLGGWPVTHAGWVAYDMYVHIVNVRCQRTAPPSAGAQQAYVMMTMCHEVLSRHTS